MEKLSKCCNVKRKLIDNWASNHNEEDIRFTYVCSECEKEFIISNEKELSEEVESKYCRTCGADLPPNHSLKIKK